MTNKSEKKIASIILEELKKTDVIDIAKKDKDFEKRIRQIVSDVLVDAFKVLYQHNNLFKNLTK